MKLVQHPCGPKIATAQRTSAKPSFCSPRERNLRMTPNWDSNHLAHEVAQATSARGLDVLVMLMLTLLVGGCSTIRVTDPARTATEQFLMSEAAREAVGQIAAGPLRDREVFIDERYFPSSDQVDIVVLGEFRAHLIMEGVRLVDHKDEAEIIVEVRTGGVGVDRDDSLIGIPAFALPATVGGAGVGSSVITPEVAITKTITQRGYAGIAYVAYFRDTSEVVAASGPYVGDTYREDWWFLGIGPNTLGDIPSVELQNQE